MSVYLVWSVTDYPGGRERTETVCALWSADDTAADYAAARAYCDRESRRRSAGESVKRVVVADSKAAALAMGGAP